MIERMFESEGLPAGLATMQPGPVLGALLSSVDRVALNGHELVTLARVRARQVAHNQAELYADMVEISYCPPGGPTSGVERLDDIDEFASDELRAALTLTRRAAESELDMAWRLRERLPRVWDALHAGVIDARRARTFVHGTGHLDPDTARKVVAQVVDKAPKLTTGQLAALLRRLCVEVDPDQAKKEYQHAVADRRVVAEPNLDGTAALHGINLPPDRVNVIRDRINTLAKTLRGPNEARSIDQLRADVFLDLLEGNTSTTGGKRGVVDIHVDLATLAGLVDKPGEIPGWGPVIADIARQIAIDHGGQWRTTITHPDTGHILWNGTTRRRPRAGLTRHIQARHPNCVFPGCRMPARDCDLDHNQPWSDGGPTTEHNLAPFCRHDHTVKHRRNWQIRHNHQGHYTLTSPLGHTYTTTGKPP